ncbi:MAG: hypothetical protein ABIP51_01585 [Bacteroidia bacterium]
MKYIVYHSTGKNFNRFSLKPSIQGIIWFTDDKDSVLNNEVGAQGKGFILTCEITINNPCGWEEYEKLMLEQITDAGYDGIILPDGEFNTYVVFNPNQIKILKRDILKESWDNRKYLSWKRKNVTIRGIKDRYASDNGSGARFGAGLYTAFLSNSKMAKGYGDLYFVLNAIPKKAPIFKDTNQAEIFQQNLIVKWCEKNGVEYDPNTFHKQTTMRDEMIANGYDGLIIKGREMVNYTPDENKIKYFQNERQLKMYYDDFIEDTLTEDITLDIDKGDTIKTGRFKNHKVVVKDIDTDEHGLPLINGKQILKIRIPKLEETLVEKILREGIRNI